MAMAMNLSEPREFWLQPHSSFIGMIGPCNISDPAVEDSGFNLYTIKHRSFFIGFMIYMSKTVDAGLPIII